VAARYSNLLHDFSWPGVQKPLDQYGPEGVSTPAPAAAAADGDDDDFDLFGEEDEEEVRARWPG